MLVLRLLSWTFWVLRCAAGALVNGLLCNPLHANLTPLTDSDRPRSYSAEKDGSGVG